MKRSRGPDVSATRPIAPLFAATLLPYFLAACGQAPEGGIAPRVPRAPTEPRRIVSLAPNLTEILFALGLRDRIVGVTDYCDYPPAAREKARVGGFVNPSLEAIVSLEPDLAVATPNSGNRDAVLRLGDLGIECLVVDTPDLTSLFEAIRRIATRAGVAERGEDLAQELSDGVDAIRRRVASLPPTRTLLVFSHEPLIVAGIGTFFDEMLAAAGGVNLAVDSGARYPHYSLERVLEAAPEAIIDTGMAPRGDGTESFWSRWRMIPAVRDGRICAPPADPILRPGPRVVVGLALLAECLHPGAVPREEELVGRAEAIR